MPPEQGCDVPDTTDSELARLVLQSGLATPEQVSATQSYVRKMRTLGVESDLLEALVDRNVIDRATARRLRRQAAPGDVDFEDESKESGAPTAGPARRGPWRLIAVCLGVAALTGLVMRQALKPSPRLKRAGELKRTVLRLEKTGSFKQALAAAEELASIPTEGSPRLRYLVEWGDERAGPLRLAVARAELDELRGSMTQIASPDQSKLLEYRAKLSELAERHKGLAPVKAEAENLIAAIDDRINEMETGKAEPAAEVAEEEALKTEAPPEEALMAGAAGEVRALAKASRYSDALDVIQRCRNRLPSRSRETAGRKLDELKASTLAEALEAFRRKDAAARAHMWSGRYGEARKVYGNVVGTFGVDEITRRAETFLKRLVMVENAASRSPDEAEKKADPRTGSGSEADWRDVVTLTSGVELSGLIVSETRDSLEFDVVRNADSVSKMRAMRMRIARKDIGAIRKLDDDQRAAASTYLADVATEGRRDANAMARLIVEPTQWPTIGGMSTRPARMVQLEHFVIVADLDEDLFRKVAVRLAKVFDAYKDHFGVDRHEFEKVRVVIFNSSADYHASLEAIGVDFLNPAFYAPGHKLIVAGFPLAEMKTAITRIRKNHAKSSEQLDEWRSQLDEAREEARKVEHQIYELVQRAGKVTPRQRKVIRAAMKKMRTAKLEWEVEIAKVEKDIKSVQEKVEQLDRRNDRIFEEHTQHMMCAIRHEGFHAFLDQFLFEEGLVEHVPRWLNEGLAQYFENGRVEAGRLVLGQVDSAMLAAFRRSGALVSIEELVASDANDYIAHKIGDAVNSESHYLTAWRLVHLLGEEGRLTKENLEAFVALASFADERTGTQEALPLLTGMRNAELERRLQYVVVESIKGDFPADSR
jgi:hypothetical protein